MMIEPWFLFQFLSSVHVKGSIYWVSGIQSQSLKNWIEKRVSVNDRLKWLLFEYTTRFFTQPGRVMGDTRIFKTIQYDIDRYWYFSIRYYFINCNFFSKFIAMLDFPPHTCDCHKTGTEKASIKSLKNDSHNPPV